MNVASVCLQIGYPAVPSVPHSIISGYQRVLALSVETQHTFPPAEKVKAFLADPSAFVATAPVAAATTASPAAASPAKVEAKKEWEESDEDMGFGLFNHQKATKQKLCMQNKEINAFFFKKKKKNGAK
uniref:Large ribosomal subunit protein uL10 n=1 Tax=Sciurus vulgaris TaxID=55149 RepID=A0A8D2DYP2_SCIVU